MNVSGKKLQYGIDTIVKWIVTSNLKKSAEVEYEKIAETWKKKNFGKAFLFSSNTLVLNFT